MYISIHANYLIMWKDYWTKIVKLYIKLISLNPVEHYTNIELIWLPTYYQLLGLDSTINSCLNYLAEYKKKKWIVRDSNIQWLDLEPKWKLYSLIKNK